VLFFIGIHHVNEVMFGSRSMNGSTDSAAIMSGESISAMSISDSTAEGDILDGDNRREEYAPGSAPERTVEEMRQQLKTQLEYYFSP